MQLYAITDRRLLGNHEPDRRVSLVELARTWARNNIDYIQVREKDLAPSDLAKLSRHIVAAVRAENQTTRVLFNGPPDIAFDTGADGIHLPANSLPIAAERARDLFARAGRDAILSHACHSREEVLKVKEESQRNPHATAANTLILFAPVFEKTIPGKNPLPGSGLEALRLAVENAHPVPVFALGGVTLENAPACVAAGAAGIAAIRLFLNSDWP